MGRTLKILLVGGAIVVAVAVLAGGAAWLAWRDLDRPLEITATELLVVPPGAALRSVSAELGARGVLPRPWLLTLYGRLTDDAVRIHAGEYELTPGLTPRSLLGKLVAGQVLLHQLTVVEGSRFTDFITVLRAHPAIATSDVAPEAVMATLGAPETDPEGLFFPDTYRFPRGTRDIDVLRIAYEAMQRRLAAAWERRTADIEIATPYEALVLASIIEKETGLASERTLISGVFHERLRRGMRLQTDPTVIYGLGASFDGNLRQRDLRTDTPYNTYTRGGLPPTPIALPGAESLEAAVAPQITGALFFVASGLGDGSHVFSATLEEHNAAVREFLRRTSERQP